MYPLAGPLLQKVSDDGHEHAQRRESVTVTSKEGRQDVSSKEGKEEEVKPIIEVDSLPFSLFRPSANYTRCGAL